MILPTSQHGGIWDITKAIWCHIFIKECIPLRWCGSGSVIWDHSDHGGSNEPMNPLWKRIHGFIWSTMIHVISDHWSWSTSSQRNAPNETAKFLPLLMQLLHWQFLVALCYHTSLLYFAFFVAHVATACSHWHSWYFHHNNHLQTCYKRKPSWKLSFPKNLPHAKTDKTEQV